MNGITFKLCIYNSNNSRIYEVLDSIAIRGDILVSHGNTPQYTPVPAKELIKTDEGKQKKILNWQKNH